MIRKASEVVVSEVLLLQLPTHLESHPAPGAGPTWASRGTTSRLPVREQHLQRTNNNLHYMLISGQNEKDKKGQTRTTIQDLTSLAQLRPVFWISSKKFLEICLWIERSLMVTLC